MGTLLSVAKEYKTTSNLVCSEKCTSDFSGSCNDSTSSETHSASVHALNILRALYRDSRLGEHIIPFIPEGVEIAVHGFSASLWPVCQTSSHIIFSLILSFCVGA